MYKKDKIKSFLPKNYSKLGVAECSKLMDCSKGYITMIAKEMGLKVSEKDRIKRISETHKKIEKKKVPYEKMRVNPSKFENITDPEVAYFLGFIWADGYVNKDKVVATIVEADGEELKETLKKIGDIDHYYRHQNKKWQPQICFQMNNRVIAKILKNLGYIEKSFKSANKVLSVIPERLWPCWFKGFFDGDGYLYFKEGDTSSRFTLTANIKHDWQYMIDICKKLNIKYKISKDKYKNKKGKINSRSVFRVHNRKDIVKFCQYIFEDDLSRDLGMKRKSKKWEEYKKYFKKIEKEKYSKTKVFLGEL